MRLGFRPRHAARASVCLHGSQSKALPFRALRRAPESPLQLLSSLLKSSRQCHMRRALKQDQDQNDRQAAGDWAALAYTEEPEEIPAGLQEKLNRVCNAGLKLMLKDSSIRELEEYKDKVSELGAEFSSKEDVQGATFAYVLYMMTEHVLVDAIDNLQGVYKAASLKMFNMLEDSGWKLNKEGEENTEMPEDQQTLPDVPTLGSYSGIV